MIFHIQEKTSVPWINEPAPFGFISEILNSVTMDGWFAPTAF